MITEFEKEKVFWTRKMNEKLVKFIKSRPNIWNPTHPKYSSVEVRDRTYHEFAAKYDNEFTGQAVRERWTNIRSTFANYLRKVNATRAVSGEEYNVNWHLWEPCQFLMKVSRKVRPSTSREDGNEEVTNDNDDSLWQDLEQNWSTEEDFENNDSTNDSTCKHIAENLFDIFKNLQSGAFGLENTRNDRIGRIVAKKLSRVNSYDAAQISQKIMDILLLYDEHNPMNPNNDIKNEDL